MRAYLINSTEKTVTEVKYNGPYTEICRLGGFEMFAIVGIGEGDAIYVDDEGLLTMADETRFFQYEGYPTALAGNGVVLGSDEEGETVGATIELEDLKRKIKFGYPDEVPGPLALITKEFT